MFVGSIASVHNGNVEMARYKVRRTGSGVAHDQAIGLHGVEVEGRVEKRFPFFQAAGFRLQVHGRGAKARSGGPKHQASARGIFEESESNSLSAKDGEFF